MFMVRGVQRKKHIGVRIFWISEMVFGVKALQFWIGVVYILLKFKSELHLTKISLYVSSIRVFVRVEHA